MNTYRVTSALQLQNYRDDDSIIKDITPKRKSDSLTIKNLEETKLLNDEDKNVSSKLYYSFVPSSKVDIY